MDIYPGVTCTAWEQGTLDAKLVELRGSSRYPLTFAEFFRLIRSGFLGTKPEEADKSLYANDPVLSKSDDALLIAANDGKLSAGNIRQLRRKWIYSRASKAYFLNRAEDEKIIEYIRPKLVGSSPSQSDFIVYLEKFHKKIIEEFFLKRPLPLVMDDLKYHSYIAAGSGHGKTELMKAVMYEVMKQGHGVILLDPHGDVAEQVSHWKEFSDDPNRLFYFDTTLDDIDSYPVINPLDPIQKATPELLDSTIETFLETIPAVIGADGELSSRMETILKPCLYMLAQVPDSTMHDLLDFISEKQVKSAEKGDKYIDLPGGWVERAKKKLTNRAQLNTLDDFFESTYKVTKGAIADRLRTLLSSDTLEGCLIGKNSVDLPALMDSGKVCVFNLSAGQLGQKTSPAFGRLLLCAIQGAAMRRQEIDEGKRKPVFLFIDEADRFISPAVVSIYKETRKYGLHLCLVQQITGFNMVPDVWRAIIGNSRVKFAGASGDDETLKDLSRMVSVEPGEISSLHPLNFYMKSLKDAPVKFKLEYKLLRDSHGMAPDEWESVKRFQIGKYYQSENKKKTGSKKAYSKESEEPIDFRL